MVRIHPAVPRDRSISLRYEQTPIWFQTRIVERTHSGPCRLNFAVSPICPFFFRDAPLDSFGGTATRERQGKGPDEVKFPSPYAPTASRFGFQVRQADAYSPSTRRRCSSRISSAMLVRDSRTSSANGAFGRQDRQVNAGVRLVTAASR